MESFRTEKQAQKFFDQMVKEQVPGTIIKLKSKRDKRYIYMTMQEFNVIIDAHI